MNFVKSEIFQMCYGDFETFLTLEIEVLKLSFRVNFEKNSYEQSVTLSIGFQGSSSKARYQQSCKEKKRKKRIKKAGVHNNPLPGMSS